MKTLQTFVFVIAVNLATISWAQVEESDGGFLYTKPLRIFNLKQDNGDRNVLLKIRIAKNIDGYFVSIFNMYCTKSATSSPGNRALLKLTNGEVLTIYTHLTDYSKYEGNNVYSISTIYDVEEEELSLLSAHGIEKVRIQYDNYNQDAILLTASKNKKFQQNIIELMQGKPRDSDDILYSDF